MEETLISFDTAVLAKKKGFKESCKHCYREDGFLYSPRISGSEIMHSNILDGDNCSAPTQGLLQKWLREVHNMYVTAMPSYGDNGKNKKCFFEIFKERRLKQYGDIYSYFPTYEETLEVGLQEALKLIE